MFCDFYWRSSGGFMGGGAPWNTGGHWPRKGVWGCAALKTPFSHLSCSLQGSHFKQKSQFTRPPFEKLGNFSLYSLNFCQNFSSQAPNLEIFSSQAPKFGNFQFTSPLFQRQVSVHKPHTSEVWAAHPYLKKVECPSPGLECTLSYFCRDRDRPPRLADAQVLPLFFFKKHFAPPISGSASKAKLR